MIPVNNLKLVHSSTGTKISITKLQLFNEKNLPLFVFDGGRSYLDSTCVPKFMYELMYG